MNRVNARMVAGLTLVSALTLTYEVIQTRVFSYSLHPVIAYTAIAIAMLGFGLGATVLSVGRTKVKEPPFVLLGWLSVGLAASIVLVNAWFSRVSINIIEGGTFNISVWWSAAALLPCILPYFVSGLITAIILEAGMERIGRVYFYNLAGSAMGCIVSIPLLRPLGAERIMLLAAVAAGLAGVLFAYREKGLARWTGGAVALAVGAMVPFAPAILPFEPDANEAVMRLIRMDEAMGRPEPTLEFTQWDPLGRIDVIRHGRSKIFVEEATGYRSVTIDGGAMTLLVEDPGKPRWGKALFEDSIYGAAHRLRKDADVMVIGVGGGTDVNTALYWGARSVTGVEISLSTLRAITGPYRKFAGFAEDPRVKLVHSDGRSFARSTKQRFDIIQLSGVDTITMHATGSMVLAEDYLYTTDAFEDFISLLEPGGILSVTRFGNEAISLSAIAASALRRLGVVHPEDHIAALRQDRMSGALIKKEPWTQEEIGTILSMEDRQKATALMIPHYDSVGLRLGVPIQVLWPSSGRTPDPSYVTFFEAMASGNEKQALKDLGIPFIVPTDDRPYYMMGYWMTLLDRAQPYNPLPRLISVTSSVTAAAALILILIPVVWLRRRPEAKFGHMLPVLVYFFALGAGFMLLEVGLINRMVVFVGTPGATVSVVLASILVSSSIGSRASGMVPWPLHVRLWAALGGLLVVGLVQAFAGEAILDPFFGLPMWARALLAALLLSPAGFFMGWFFPRGLGITASRAPSLVPWAIAVNGFASVIGSLSTLILGMALGFRFLYVLALAGYVVAVAVITPFSMRGAREDR